VSDLGGLGLTIIRAVGRTGGLLVTGQTTQYAGYDDDGFYEIGIAQRYNVLTAGQYAGTTAITLNAKVENHSNNCVEDLSTGRMWSRTVSGPNVGPANNGLLPWTTAGGEGIFPYIAAANAASLAKHNDWRVPNKEELDSLQSIEAPTGVPDVAAFPGWPAFAVWTSSTRPDATTNGIYCHFSWGTSGFTAKTTSYYCALVRG